MAISTALIVTSAGGVTAAAATLSSTSDTVNPIFAIGSVDGSDADLALAPGGYNDYSATFPDDVHYTAGTSTADHDWSYIQPGPSDTWAGSTQHPFTISYSLDSVPTQDPTLWIGYVDSNSAAQHPPTVRVNSNDTVAQTTTLPGGGGGGVFGQSPETPTSLKVDIPVGSLRPGANTITITNTAGSWSVYDGLELMPPLPAGTTPDVSVDAATPTVLFANGADGSQPQIVNATVFNTGAAGPVTFTANTDGSVVTTDIANVPQGFSTQQVQVTPAAGPGPANLTITSSAGGSKQAQLPYQRRWQVDLINGSHQDIGYDGLQSAMRTLQDQYLDTAVKACQDTSDYPPAARFHWTIEHSWTLENYVADRTKAQVQALAGCLKSGQFELEGTYDNQLYDLASGEQMARALYAGVRTLPTELGVSRPTSAIQDDVTGVTWQDIQDLQKAGISYLMNGANPTRAPRPEDDPALFWWQAPNGSKVLTWYSGPNAYPDGFSMGLQNDTANIPAAAAAISGKLTQLQAQGYTHQIYPIQMLNDNAAPVTGLSDLVRSWNATYAYPKLTFTTPTPFFQAAAKDNPTSIPTHSGDWSDWWSDGAGSSAEQTAQTRQAQTRTTTAETLGALSSLTTPTDGSRQTQLDQAQQQAELYTEHTWGAANPSIDDPEWPVKEDFATQADKLSTSALGSATGDLAAQTRNASPWPEVAVWNSLSWQRSGPVRETVPEGALDGRPFRLVDGQDQAVPYQLVSRSGGSITLKFVARNVPSVGYATYHLVPATDTAGIVGTGADPALRATATGLANQFFTVTLDPKTGTITSVYDKARHTELVDSSSSFQANQFVYRPNCAGTNKGNACLTSAANQWSPTKATVQVVSAGPVSATIQVTADPGAGGATTGISALTQTITLYAGIPEVYISDTVNKTQVETAEEAYFAFPFQVAKPQVTYEVPDASVRFFTDQLPGSALDWQGVQSYADVSNSQGGVTFSTPDAPLVEFDHIRTQEFLTRPGHLDGTPDQVDPSKYLPTNGSIFSYTYNNLWFTNYRIAQSGPTTFHYGIGDHTGAFDAVADTHTGENYQTALVPVAVPGRNGGSYVPGDHSLVSVDEPNVVVQTTKQADAGGAGLTVRLAEVAGQGGTAHLRLPFQVGSATLDDVTEQPVSSLTTAGNEVSVPVEKHGVVTVTVVPQLALTAQAGSPRLARGQSVPVTVTLRNNSHQQVSGTVSLGAADGLTVSPASRAVDIAPGAVGTAVFTVTAPATTDVGPVTLTASADLGPGTTLNPTLTTVQVVNPIDVVASPDKPDLVEGKPSPISVTVTNNLATTATATVRLTTPDGWTVQPSTSDLSLAAGDSKTVTVTVTPPAGSIGSPVLHAVADGAGTTTTVDLPATVSKPIAFVGAVDGSQDEFALAPNGFGNYRAKFPNGVDFTYGSGDPATDWSYIQPGPQDAWAGNTAHTFTFRFNLDQAPTTDLSFTAWLVDTNNNFAPTLQVGLNGGTAQTVALPAGGGDGYHWGDGTPDVAGGIQPTTFAVTLPAAGLHAGTNTVTLTDSAGSWLVYDAFGVLQRP
jgi:hypothetical protein